jgi:hypothetical protein
MTIHASTRKWRSERVQVRLERSWGTGLGVGRGAELPFVSAVARRELPGGIVEITLPHPTCRITVLGSKHHTHPDSCDQMGNRVRNLRPHSALVEISPDWMPGATSSGAEQKKLLLAHRRRSPSRLDLLEAWEAV